jgi:hypothetical protein
MPKTGKFSFTLKNIDTIHLEKLYNLNLNNSDNSATTNISESEIKTTKLSDLNKDTIKFVSFLDETKNSHNCSISLINIDKIDIDDPNKNYNCYWCRNAFDSYAVGCPIRYVPKQCIKNYYSNISKDFYKIKEDISDHKFDMLKDDKDYTLKDSYYETDGIFCSFNCCKAFINENKHKKIYNMSLYLLNKMYRDITGEYCKNIITAPHWRTLKEYGGHLDIDDFRNGFNKNSYTDQGTIKNINIKPIINLYEEKILF